jgi:hypothetical protein
VNASDYVTLTGGLTVPLDVLRFAWSLEDRGCRFRVDGDGLVVGPPALLTEADRDAIRQWREHIKALIAYCERSEVCQ